MLKKLIAICMAAGLALLPHRAWAFIDVGQGDWISGQNALLLELLATEAEELANVAALLANIKMVVESANEGLAIARSTYKAYQTVRDYSIDDLVSDAKRGLYEAFPDLEHIESDLSELSDQYESRGSFWSYWGKYDREMMSKVDKVMRHAYKASIWPHVFPNAMLQRKNPSPVDVNIWKLYKKSGMEMEVAVKKTALAVLSKKVAYLVDDARQSKNIALQSQTLNAQINHQNMVDNQEHLDLVKAELAKREDERGRQRKTDRAFDMTMGDKDRLDGLFRADGQWGQK